MKRVCIFNINKIIFYILLVSVQTCLGQSVLTSINERFQNRTIIGYQYWQADDDKVQQLAVPLTFSYLYNEKLKFEISGASAFSNSKTGASAAFNGLADTRFSGSYMFGEEKFLFSFGANLPSGKNALNAEEFSVANILALHVLNFQVPILGQGLDLSTGLVMAQPFAGWVLGLGAGYLRRGAYEPFKDLDFSYDPGDEITISIGADKDIGRRNKFMFDFGYTLYGSDKTDTLEVFKAGNRFSIRALGYIEGEFFNIVLSLQDRIQSKNKIGTGNLAPEAQNSNGNELEFLALGNYQIGRETYLKGIFEVKLYSDNAYKIGGAQVAGIGSGFRHSLTDHVDLDTDIRFYVGTLNIGKDVTLKGLQFNTGLKIAL